METILSKISAYNILNYFLSGSIICLAASFLFGLDISDFKFYFLILFYSVGIFASRVGAIFIEPIIHRYLRLKNNSYAEFIRAEVLDPKISTLVEQANFYRTLLSGFFVLLLSELTRQAFLIDSFREVLALNLAALTFCNVILVLSLVRYQKFITARVTEAISSR